MTILRAILDRRSVENPLRPLTDASLLDVLGGAPTEAGVSVTPETAYRMTAVYRCIAILAGLMGALPLHEYRRAGERREREPSSLMDEPHPDQTGFEVREFLGQSLLSYGNAYALKQRNGLGRVVELEPLHGRSVHTERKTAWRSAANPSGKRFVVTDGATSKTYTPFDLWHIPGLSYDGVVGMSPIQYARQAIGLGLAAEAFGARLFSRGALMQAVLETDQQFEDDGPARRMREQFRMSAAGADNQWAIPVIDSGAKYKPIGLPPEDVQFIQTRQFSVVEIARLFGLPPHLVGAIEKSTSWGTGIEQQNMQMLTFTADPWLVRFEQRATRELLLDRTYFRFNRGALLRADTAGRYLAYQRAIQFGWLNADEIRALEEHDPLPDGLGQTFYRPASSVPVTAGDDDDDDGSPRALTEMVQKIYLGVGKVVTADEAREILNRAGAGLVDPWTEPAEAGGET